MKLQRLLGVGLKEVSPGKTHPAAWRRAQRGLALLLPALCLFLALLSPAAAGDGALDPNFNPGLGVSQHPVIWSPTYYNSGKLLIAGSFTEVYGAAHTTIARLNVDSSLDINFNAAVVGKVNNCILINPASDLSQILIAGPFSLASNTGPYYGLARLNSNGTVDDTFVHAFGPGGGGQCIGLQSDGKIVMGGWSLPVTGYPGTYHLLRLLDTGAVDDLYPKRSTPGGFVRGIGINLTNNQARLFGTIPRFSAPTLVDYMLLLASDGNTVVSHLGEEVVNGPIINMATDSAGKVVIVGQFTQVYGTSVNRVARLTEDMGALDNFNIGGSGAPNLVQRVNIQSDDKIVLAGDFSSFNGTPCGFTVRLNVDGSVDNTFTTGTGADDRIWTMFKRGDGTWMVAGTFRAFNGSPRHGIAILAANGSLNTGYSNVTTANTAPWVVHVIQDSYQGLLIGGDFTGYGGKYHSGLARVNFDGTPDNSFRGGANGVVKSISYDWQGGSGKILIAGEFGNAGGYFARTSLARFNADGTIDMTFKPVIVKSDGSVPDLPMVQSGWNPSGTILVGGDFATVNGVACSSIARLNADGTLDPSLNFDPASSMPALTNIKIHGASDDDGGPFVIAGKAVYNSATSGFFTRLLHDGSLDPSFANGPGHPVLHVVVFNGKVKCGTGDETGVITLGGEFTQILDGATNIQRNYLARFTPDGTLDSTFAPAGPNGPIYALETQWPSSKVFLGGAFTSYNGVARNNLARMKGDGSLDTSFNPGTGANGPVLAFAWNDYIRRVRVGGAFTTYNDISRIGLAQIVAGSSFNPAFLMLLDN